MKVTKTQFDALPKELQKLFKQVGDTDSYDNGEEEAAALKTARDRERDAAKALREEKTTLETRITELEEEVETTKGSTHGKDEEVQRIKDKAARDIAKAKTDAQAKVDKMTGLLRKTHVDKVASDLARELFTEPVADVMASEVAKYLSVNIDGDEPSTEVLGPDGKPTARTLQELKQDFLGNPKFASILVGSKGSGGGAGGAGNGGGAFDIKTYRNEDGTTNWTKVHQGMKEDPTVLDKVRAANTTTPHVAPKA